MLRKGVYPSKYIDNWKKFNETKLLTKEELYSNLNIKDITYVNFKHVRRVWKAVIQYSNDTNDIYKSIDEYNPGKEPKVLILFHDMIADMICNKKA